MTDTPCTITAALAQCEAAGWRLNNLMYLDNGLYRASLRSKDIGFEFGQAHDPAEALLIALRYATEGRGEPLIEGSGQSISAERKTRTPINTAHDFSQEI